MNRIAKLYCFAAEALIADGNYAQAISNLQHALKGTTNRRAWSKLMLAIRELNRVAK